MNGGAQLPDVSIIIPVYNEKGGLKPTLEAIREAVRDDAFSYEIIVVDDGSKDDLKRSELGDLVDQFHRHRHNMGYGAAIKTGLRHGRGQRIVITDADGTYPAEPIPKLARALDDCEMAVGARTGKNVQIPLIRQPAKYVLRRLAHYLAERPIPDLNSGLRAFWKKDAEPYLHILPRGFSLTTTITLAFLCDDLRVLYFPIDYHKRVGKSKIRPIRDTKNILMTIIRTVLYFNPIKVCAPISAFFFVASLVVLLVSAGFMDRVMDGTVSVLALSGVQILSIGLLADLIARRSGR